MYGYVLQDWITIRGGAVADIIQGESTWMGFSSFQDLIIWLDVREIAGIDATHALTWYFETAPSKDSNLFTPMPTSSSGISLNTTNFTAGVQALTKVVLANAATTVPLATWVRWRLSPQAGITTLFGHVVTFQQKALGAAIPHCGSVMVNRLDQSGPRT